MKKILKWTAPCLLLLTAILLFNTFRFRSRQVSVEPAHLVTINEKVAAERLAQALCFQTISSPEHSHSAEFSRLHQYLSQAFPQCHATLERETVGEYSLLYTWKGNDAGLKPLLLLAHLDVVPVEPATEKGWHAPPFEGRIADGYIWGRGALDDKASVVAILEAVEMLLNENFQLRRTIYLAFGHDEEVGGLNGAACIAALLQSRGVEPDLVLDEGGGMVDGGPLSLPGRVATIGIAEKGFVSLELSAESEGGHSSMPPPHTAIGVLSAAITRLEAEQMPGNMDGVMRQMFEHLGPEMPFARRLVMANLWLFRPLVERQLARRPAANALLRTTTAATLIEGGVKDNILPARARAVVNFRIRPGDTIASVTDHVRRGEHRT